jgi:putative phage-type endonuclease
MKVVDMLQRTNKWLEWRLTGIGASDSAVIVGMSRYNTLLKLWEEKTGRAFKNDINADMQRGIDLEEEALMAFNINIESKFSSICGKHDYYSFIQASFDGMNEDGTEFVELKCPRTYKLLNVIDFQGSLELKKEYPEYWVQIQHQYLVSGALTGYIAAYLDNKISMMLVEKDDDFIESILIPRLCDFWNNYVEADVAPQSSSSDLSYENDEECVSLSIQLRFIEDKIKELEVQKESLRKELIEKSGDKTVVIGDVVKISKITNSRIDYRKACEENFIDLDKYRKSDAISYRFSYTLS